MIVHMYHSACCSSGCGGCGYVRKGSYITDIGVYFEQTDTLQLPHMQAHGVPHLARLVGYEIHYVQTCTSASTYAYSAPEGATLEEKVRGQRGKEEARREREQAGGQGRWD